MAYLNLQTFEYGTSLNGPQTTNIVEVDENLVPILSALNKKGYSTVRSDEGHIQRTLDDSAEPAIIVIPYIAFEKGITLPNIPDGWATMPDIDPFDQASTEENSGICLIADLNYSSDNELEFSKKKYASLFALANWADVLPPFNSK